jgi:hypothetical protein
MAQLRHDFLRRHLCDVVALNEPLQLHFRRNVGDMPPVGLDAALAVVGVTRERRRVIYDRARRRYVDRGALLQRLAVRQVLGDVTRVRVVLSASTMPSHKGRV